MSLYRKLQERAALMKPIRVGLIGAGKFGSMFLAQVRRTPGMHLMGVADLSPTRAEQALARVGWEEQRYRARSPIEALERETTYITDDALALISAERARRGGGSHWPPVSRHPACARGHRERPPRRHGQCRG